jgi:uncharacterized glyoxalase superfamily protein PhnB
MIKITPTLIVEKIEPSLKFWTETLGFTKVADVAGEKGLVFAMLVKDTLEVHFQTRESAGTDIPYLKDCKNPPATFLYIDVKDVKTLYEKFKNLDILLPLEKTFYGATHFFIREPGGHVLGFSENNTQ